MDDFLYLKNALKNINRFSWGIKERSSKQWSVCKKVCKIVSPSMVKLLS